MIQEFNPSDGDSKKKNPSNAQPQNKPHKPKKSEGLGSLGSLGQGCENKEEEAFVIPDVQPPFPTECFSEPIQKIIRETARVAQVPEALAGGVALGCLSAALRSSVKGEMVSEMFTNPNLYILGIAKSGTGKGRTFSILEKPLKEAEAELEETFFCSTRPMIELEVKQKKDQLKETQESKNKEEIQKLSYELSCLEKQLQEQPSMFCDDITKEALAELLSQQDDETLSSHSSEARGLIDNLMGQYSGGVSEESIYCKLYSGDPIKVNRRAKDKKSISLRNPHLSITWLLQPDSAERLSSNEAMMESGLVPRFLIFNAHAEMADEPEELLRIEKEVKNDWRYICLTLLGFKDKDTSQNIITPSNEAFRLLRRFSNEAKREGRITGALSDLPQFPSRYGENARKIAIILHASEHLDDCFEYQVSEKTAQKAIDLMQWFIWEQLAFLGDARYQRNYARASKLKDWLLKKADHQATLGAVKKGIKYENEEVRKLAEEFPTFLEVSEVNHGAQGGRPSTIVRIPKLGMK